MYENKVFVLGGICHCEVFCTPPRVGLWTGVGVLVLFFFKDFPRRICIFTFILVSSKDGSRSFILLQPMIVWNSSISLSFRPYSRGIDLYLTKKINVHNKKRNILIMYYSRILKLLCNVSSFRTLGPLLTILKYIQNGRCTCVQPSSPTF